jgi:hypothetical protein
MANNYPEESGKKWNLDLSDEEQAEVMAALQKATEIEQNVLQRKKERGEIPPEEPPMDQIGETMEFTNEAEEEPPPVVEDVNAPGYHQLSEFEKLCRVGYIEDTKEIAGNRISLRTLDQGEEIEALNRADRFRPAARGQAFACYVLAQALQAVNGKNWFKRSPMSPDDDTLDEKFQAILRINPYITDKMITFYRDLEREVNEKAQYAGKGSAPETPSGATSDES